MGKTIYIPNGAKRSGIDITWNSMPGIIEIGGWYDSCVAIEGRAMTLAQFFEELGITAKDVKRAMKPDNTSKK